MLQLVRAGIGAALVPSAAAVMHLPSVRFKEVGLPEAAWDIALVWKKRPERTLLVEAFVGVARQVYEARSR